MTKTTRLQIGIVSLSMVSLFLAFQLFFSPSSKQASSAESNVQAGTLVVSDVGEVSMEPDMAYIYLGAQAVASSAEETQTQVNERINAIRQVLKEHGVAEEHIQTSRFHVYPQHNWNAQGNEITEERYRAEHMLEVQYMDISTLGELIDAASSAGANQIEQIQFALQNPEAAEYQALQQAIEKTASKAAAMAESAGKERGEVLQIADQAAQVNLPIQNYAIAEEATQESSRSTAIEAGEIQVTQRVDVIYQLQ